MSELAVSNTERTVRRKIGFFDNMDTYKVVGAGLFGQIGGLLFLSPMLDMLTPLDTFPAILTGTGTALGVFLAALRVRHVYNSQKQLRTILNEGYNPGLASHVKTLTLSLSPYFKTKTDIDNVSVSVGNEGSLKRKGYFCKSDPVYTMETKMVYRPFSSYIEQKFIATPETFWDQAFNATKNVYEFSPQPTMITK